MILILAYGNSLRRDDGAGFALADIIERLLHEAGTTVGRIDSHQLGPELALDMAADNISAVVFVDTRAVSDTSDNMQVRIRPTVDARSSSPALGHQLDDSVLMAYIRHLFDKAPPAWLITVPGVDFSHGEGLSDTCRRAIDNGQERS